MAKKRKPTVKRTPILLIAGIAAIAVVLLSAGGFAFAASQEQHDTFCASCHTQPETTFYQRSTAATPTDLASFHTTKATNCIDCHSGAGITGRLSAEMMGARNAVLWFSGTAQQPAPLVFPIGNDNCMKCHATVTSGVSSEGRRGTFGPQGHYHRFLSRWQAADPNAATCVSCHAGHDTAGDPNSAYVNIATVQQTCNACHNVLGRGD